MGSRCCPVRGHGLRGRGTCPAAAACSYWLVPKRASERDDGTWKKRYLARRRGPTSASRQQRARDPCPSSWQKRYATTARRPQPTGGSATTARPPVIPPPIQRHVAESQTPVSRRRSLPQTRKLAHRGNLGTSQMRQRKRNDILHTGWGRAKLQDGARLHYTLKSANPAAGLIPLPSPSVHLAGAWGSALGSGGRRASPPRFLSRGYLSPSVRSPRCTCDASQRGGGSIGSAGAPGGDFSQFRAAGPIQVNNERHRSPGRISAQRRKVQRPARREETRRCDRWMSASWVHAMYSGGTFRQRGTASLPASSFFFSFFSLPPETPEGGEEANPKGRKPLRPRSFPPRWLGGPAQWAAPHGRGAPHRHHARAPSFRLCGLSENPTGGYVGTLGVDSVEVATRATHCTLTLSFLPCPEHPTPPAQDPSTGPRAQDPAGAPIHQSSGTLRDSPAVTSSDVKPTSPLADDVACTLHQRPSRRIDAISARVPLFAPPPTLDHRQGLRLLAQSLTTRDITEQQNLGRFPLHSRYKNKNNKIIKKGKGKKKNPSRPSEGRHRI